jgi:hypothetical protein
MIFECTAKIGPITINKDRNEPISTEITFEIGALHKTIVDSMRCSVPTVPSMEQFLKEVEEAIKVKLKLQEELNGNTSINNR